MATPAAPVEHTTELALSEKRKLVKSLGHLDMVFFTVCAIVGLDLLGQAASYGAQAFTWVVVLVVLFMFPYALLMAELGTAFPQEGGPYEWMKLTWGRLAAGIGAVLYWVTNPFWVGGSLCFIATDTWSSNIHGVGSGTFGDYAFKFIFIWISIGVAIVSLKHGKWIPNAGAIVRFLVLGLLLADGDRVRHQARRARLRPRRLLAHGRRSSSPGAAADLRVRRLRAAERRGRGDGGSAARRAPLGCQERGHLLDRLRHPDLRHRGGAAVVEDHRHRRLHGRRPPDVRRLRRRPELPHRPDGAGLHLRAAHLGRGLDDRLRPDPGRGRLRRRLLPLVRRVQREAGHAGAGERAVRRDLHHLHGGRGAAAFEQRGRTPSRWCCTWPSRPRSCPTS